MLKGLARACLLAILLFSLAVPATGSVAGPRDRLRETSSRLEKVRGRIRRHRRAALSIKDRIGVLGERITSTQITINELDTDITRLRSRVLSARARVTLLEGRIEELRRVATQQAVELYKRGAVDALDALLDAHSIAELGARIDLLGAAADHNTGALIRYGRLRAVVAVHHRAVFARERELDRARAAQAEVLATKRSLQRQLRRELSRLHDRIGHERAREGDLRRASQELKERILAAQAEHSVRILGISSQGFVWPLNGPVTSPFGSRWGGQHTGIDINGYAGQPIVAVKDGIVIYAGASMSGYGNALVLDHGGGVSTLYAHMSDYEVTGGAVAQGEVVGYVGCTGHCYGDHLHFEVRLAGNPVDPLSYLP